MKFPSILCIILFSCISIACCKEVYINQTFPRNESYCCHCPSLVLTCCFNTPPVPEFIWWSIPDENISNIAGSGVVGHTIDNSAVAKGISTLSVFNITVLRQDYACIAFYENDTPQKSRPQRVPPVEDTSESFTYMKLKEKNTTSLLVAWTHPYPECKHYTIYVNAMPTVINITGNSYTITGLTPDTEYNVTVVATEPPLPDQPIFDVFLTASDGGSNWAGHTITGSVVLIAIAILTYMVMIRIGLL